jgi:hypothetical protein
MERRRVIGGYDSMREGDYVAKSFYHILFNHNCINGEKGLHDILGRGTCGSWFPSKYINPILWDVWGFIFFFFTHLVHSLLFGSHSPFCSLFHSFILVFGMGPCGELLKRKPLFVGCSND